VPDIKLAERLKFKECMPSALLRCEMEARYAGRREVGAVLEADLVTVATSVGEERA
jgi:hypothetical protein